MHLIDREEGVGDPIVLIDGALDELRVGLRMTIDKGEELRHAMTSLLACATALHDQQDSPHTAGQIVSLLNEEEFVQAILALGPAKFDEETAEAVEKRADDLRKFTEQESDKRAPQEGEEAPEGSEKLGKLDFPKRI